MSLSRIQSQRLSAVLEDCSVQLDILGHTLSVQISRERGTAGEELLQQQLKEEVRVHKESEKLLLHQQEERVRLTKLKSNCQCISRQMFKLHLELEENQSFNSLLDVVEEEEQKKMHENMRRQEERELELREETLKRQNKELLQKTEQLKNLTQHFMDLSLQLDKYSVKLADRKKTAEKDMELLLQGAQKQISQAEEDLEGQLKLLKQQLKEEVRVHKESEKFLLHQQEGLQQQLQQSEQFTKQMLQEKEQQLNRVHNKRAENGNKQLEMRRKFIELEQVVMEDREEEEKLCQQQEQVRAATKLQAWWRGCMVRRGLGTFKKADADKKGKKKKGLKKKKK